MKNWWKESIVYQVYPRSFKDSSGNGVGDIDGIIEKLDHIASLGVDLIWICPIYQSPNADNGYDISDYRKINDEFGGNTAFERLLKAVHNRDMKLMMDLVANHSSDEHYWFQEAKKAKTIPIMTIIIGKKDFLTPRQIIGNLFSMEVCGNGMKKHKNIIYIYSPKNNPILTGKIQK